MDASVATITSTNSVHGLHVGERQLGIKTTTDTGDAVGERERFDVGGRLGSRSEDPGRGYPA
jgi:hypothetical protein